MEPSRSRSRELFKGWFISEGFSAVGGIDQGFFDSLRGVKDWKNSDKKLRGWFFVNIFFLDVSAS